MESVLSYVNGLSSPLLLLLASDRVTDGGAHVRRTALGVVQDETGPTVIRDWEVLKLLNGLEVPRVAPGKKRIDASQMQSWVRDAKLAAAAHLPKLDLPFSVPELKEILLLWPLELASQA
jgi:hypothetical protein